MHEFDGKRRLVENARRHFSALRKAAENYPERLPTGHSLRRKPFDQSKGHTNFFGCMYAALNMINELDLSPHSTIVEVGSGPGWLTEILAGLGHRVHAIEPSDRMIDEARLRLNSFKAKTGIDVNSSVTFSATTIEELDPLPRQMLADVVLYHEALHHVIDEHLALHNSFELLREGGAIAICGEGRWLVDDPNQARILYEEMDQYGTLESPFTPDYLRHVLTRVGFVDVEFFHAVNGLFRIVDERKVIKDVATVPASEANTVIARRPAMGPQITNTTNATSVVISIRRVVYEANITKISVTLLNTGETLWPSNQKLRGHVTVSLFERSSTAPSYREANRHPITRDVRPGKSLDMECIFETMNLTAPFDLDLISEHCFWFQARTPVPAQL